MPKAKKPTIKLDVRIVFDDELSEFVRENTVDRSYAEQVTNFVRQCKERNKNE